jgi:methylmalonyl-CoA carboxyltransferase small subunit
LKLQITINGRTYNAEVEVLEEEESPLQSGIETYEFFAPLPASGPYGLSDSNGESNVNKTEYLSPVTGLVIKVYVAPGQEVERDEQMMILEAMKMETSITAHHAGKVKSVTVGPGDSVKLNQVLIEFE